MTDKDVNDIEGMCSAFLLQCSANIGAMLHNSKVDHKILYWKAVTEKIADAASRLDDLLDEVKQIAEDSEANEDGE